MWVCVDNDWLLASWSMVSSCREGLRASSSTMLKSSSGSEGLGSAILTGALLCHGKMDFDKNKMNFAQFEQTNSLLNHSIPLQKADRKWSTATLPGPLTNFFKEKNTFKTKNGRNEQGQ